MGFEVTPGAITAYAGVLRRQAEHQDTAISYLEKYVEVGVEAGDGLIIPAQEYTPTIVDAAREAMQRARSFFEKSADALDRAADYYEKTDKDSAAELDKTYDGGESIEVETPGPPSDGWPDEVADPAGGLDGTPEAKKFDSGPFKGIADVNAYLSPASYIRELVKVLNNGKDIFEEAVKDVAGDWEAFAKASDACKHLAKFYAKVYSNLNQCMVLPYHWKGNASDVTVAFFANVGPYFLNSDYEPEAVECTPEGTVYEPGTEWGFAVEFLLLAEEYEKLAEDVSHFAGSINSALNNIIDTLSWSALAAAAGIATSWTGVGALTGESAAALLMGNVLSHISEYTGMVGNIKAAVDAFNGMDSMSGSPVTDLGNLKLPEPYETPPGM